MPRPKLKLQGKGLLTITQVAGMLGLSVYQVDYRLRQEIFPLPTLTSPQGVRYFSQDWVDQIKKQ